MRKYHKFHIVDQSPWPLLASISVFSTAVALILVMHGFGYDELSSVPLHRRIEPPYNWTGFQFFFSLFNTLCVAGLWFRDIVREATILGAHTVKVQKGLRLGFVLFLGSEAMFFVSFFWAFLYVSLVPAPELGGVWPPTGINPGNALGLPLVNTYLLVWSGFILTSSHYSLLSGRLTASITRLFYTLCFGFLFLVVQTVEYFTASFDISDGVYGSTFYLLTGFHGLHVLLGWMFLYVCFFRACVWHFTATRHLGFEMAIWYWHFVDVIWLILYGLVYVWGNLLHTQLI